MRRVLVCFALISSVLALGAAGAAAAPADLDRSFGGGDGIAEVPAAGDPLPGDAGARMVVGPHDEIFVLYSNYPPCDPPFNCRVGLTVARYTPDGELDPSFASDPQLTVQQSPLVDEFDLALSPDGKPVIAAYGGTGGLAVARVGLDGRLDPSFGSGGVASAPENLISQTRGVPRVAVQPDGKVLVAVEGSFEGEGRDQMSVTVARFAANGELDVGFGSGGEARPLLPTQTKPTDVFVAATGAITIPVPYCCLGGSPLFGQGFSVARLRTDGQLDPSWAGDGSFFFPTPGAEGSVEAATPTSEGGLLLSFEVSTPTVSVPGNLIKLTPDGSLDTGFGNGGAVRLFNKAAAISASDLTLDGKGRIVGVGWNSRIAVFRLRPDGGKDRTFNGGERIVLPYGGGGETKYLVGVQSNGRIIAFGDSGLGASERFGLIALRGGSDRSRCLGKKATIVGTAKPDRLTGTPRRDVIVALGGADEVRALAGPDVICGGKGQDKIFGGPGRDEARP